MAKANCIQFALTACLVLSPVWATTDSRLIDAIKRRDAKAAEELIRQKVDINTALPDGATALAWAVFLNLPDLADKLIRSGANVKTVGEYGETPLTLALANGNADLAKKLIQAGADPRVNRWNGETPLMIAAGSGNVEAARLIIEQNVDVNGADPKRLQNALMWAASEGHSGVVKLLIESGANVDAKSRAGFTPLIFAAIKNDANSIKLLLAAGADANYSLPDHTSVLTIATSSRAYLAAIALLDGGADPNNADSTGATPLHTAAQAGALDLVHKLISKKANLNVRTQTAKEAKFFAAPGELTPLLLAARSNRVEVMRALIEAGADTKLKSQDGSGLFLSAAASGRSAAAKYAFEIDSDVKAVNKNGFTAMHFCVGTFGSGASQAEMTELAQYLADIGVPIDEKDKEGRTAIQIGDIIPYDKPIQRMADIIVSRGGTPSYFPKEYIKPPPAR